MKSKKPITTDKEKVENVCYHCNHLFKSNRKQTYCSLLCRNKGLVRKKKIGNCAECNKELNDRKNLPFCSITCKHKKSNIKKSCPVCNNSFQIKRISDVYCSKKCTREQKKNNSEKFQKEVYKNNRFMIFQRDNFTCIYCGLNSKDGVNLVIDHVYPVSKGGKNDLYNLVTSCQLCNDEKKNIIISESMIVKIWDENKNKMNEQKINSKEYDGLKKHFDMIYGYRIKPSFSYGVNCKNKAVKVVKNENKGKIEDLTMDKSIGKVYNPNNNPLWKKKMGL